MPHPHLHIETERLLIRPFNLGDIEPSYAMNLDAKVSKYTGDGGVVTKAEIERRITEDVLGDYAKYGFGRLAVELKNEKRFIGFAGLKYLDDLGEVDLGYRFMKEYWGKGIATEAARACIKLGFETSLSYDIYNISITYANSAFTGHYSARTQVNTRRDCC